MEAKAPATTVESKIKDHKEPAKHPAPSRVPVGQIAELVLKLVKEDGFSKEDAVKVLTMAKEMDGASTETAERSWGSCVRYTPAIIRQRKGLRREHN